MAGTIFGANPIDVLREIANLVESVPYGKLKFALSSARRQNDLYFDQMLFGRRERDGVSDRPGRLSK